MRLETIDILLGLGLPMYEAITQGNDNNYINFIESQLF